MEILQEMEGDDITKLTIKEGDRNEGTDTEDEKEEENEDHLEDEPTQNGTSGNISTYLFTGVDNITDED
ncbi:hypothetical protein COLO4_07458 [Corchorus olitorius]|uniref:Uncharacterized protein n=1 Tax=Corchorus olitorius TaxID=93759 RepID=A0A1R3KJN9_9ROSI|nr:hypothetical protein COLO4_07458 [Corchorus olitorius]